MRDKHSNSKEISFLVDSYLQNLKGPEPDSYLKAKNEARQLMKDGISVSRTEGELIGFFVQLCRPQKFVEIGTLTGYSALWILENLAPNGKLWTFEKDPVHADIARQVLTQAQRPNKDFEVICGDAETGLIEISDQGPFDGVFIDGNKGAYGRYLQWAQKNLRSGGLLICDNVFLGGSVLGENLSNAHRFSEKQVLVMNQVNREILTGDQFHGVLLPTSEGMAIAIKK